MFGAKWVTQMGPLALFLLLEALIWLAHGAHAVTVWHGLRAWAGSAAKAPRCSERPFLLIGC